MDLYIRENETAPWQLVDEAPEDHIADVAEEWRNHGIAENNIKVEEPDNIAWSHLTETMKGIKPGELTPIFATGLTRKTDLKRLS